MRIAEYIIVQFKIQDEYYISKNHKLTETVTHINNQIYNICGNEIVYDETIIINWWKNYILSKYPKKIYSDNKFVNEYCEQKYKSYLINYINVIEISIIKEFL